MKWKVARTFSVAMLMLAAFGCSDSANRSPSSTNQDDSSSDDSSNSGDSRNVGDGSTPTPSPTSSSGPTSDGSDVLDGSAALDAEELDFVTIINDYRVQNGLEPLQVSVTLTRAADWLSVDMAEKNYFSHTDSSGRDPFDRMSDFGYPGNGYSGENIAAGNSTAQATFTQWKNSSGHNANMLGSSYRVIGIGRAQGGGYGWYWTTDFGSKVDEVVK